jgi:hypothetical protein
VERGLHVLVGEVPIVWVNFQSLIVESVSVCIDEIDDVGMLQEWNADYAHLGVLVSQWIGSSTGSVWGPRQSPQNLFCDKRADTLIQLGKDRHDIYDVRMARERRLFMCLHRLVMTMVCIRRPSWFSSCPK